MSFIRSCQSISAKCAMLPLVNELLEYRQKTGKLGRIGPCIFQHPEKFLIDAIQYNETGYTNVHTPIKIINGQQVIGIGDIHGDFLVLLGVLYLMNVIDLNGNWIGGDTIVVLCGDVLDRSGRSGSVLTNNLREEVDIVQYLHSLHRKAFENTAYISSKKRKGQVDIRGGVYWVLGNHDIARVLFKNYRGELIKKHTTPDYRKYIGNQYIGWGYSSIPPKKLKQLSEQDISELAQKNMEVLFQPGGLMARYLAYNTSFILQIGHFVFLHGSLTTEKIRTIRKQLKIYNPEDTFKMINKNVRNALEYKIFTMNKLVRKIAWDRTFSDVPVNEQNNKLCTNELRELYKEVGMNWNKGAFVVGHTIQPMGIPVYCRGRIWRIDLGMSEAFSSADILKVIGGLKITQYPYSERPFEILTVMNYSSSQESIDKFIMFVKKEYKHIFYGWNNEDPNILDNTKIKAEWVRDIQQLYDKEMKNIQKRKRGLE